MARHSQTRRELLATTSVGLGVALAGCDGQDSEDTPTATEEETGQDTQTVQDTGTEEGLGDPVEPVFDFIGRSGLPPTELVTGPEPASNWARPTYWGETLPGFTPGMANLYPSEKQIPMLADTYELSDDGTTWTVRLADEDFTWHNGKPVTIEDMYMSPVKEYGRMYEELTAEGGHGLFESLEIVDDRTMKAELKKPQHPALFPAAGNLAQPDIFDHPRWTMKPYFESMQDATTAQEAEDIHTKLTEEANVPLEEFVGHGLFQIEQVTEQSVVYTKYEDHPFADRQNIEKVRIWPAGSQSTERLLWKQDKVDAGSPPAGALELPRNMNEWKFRAISGIQLQFNQLNEHLEKRPVRRAISYWLDHNSMVQNLGQGFPPVSQTGLPEPTATKWINPDLSEFIDYGQTSQPEKADAEMQKAGYSRNGDDKWVDPDGNAVSFHLTTFEWWTTFAQSIASSMRKFGFEIELDTDGDKFWNVAGNPQAGQEGFDMQVHRAGPDDANYPAKNFEQGYWGMQTVTADGEGHWAGRPWEMTVPENIGDEEVSGSGKKLDIRNLQEKIQSPTLSEEEAKEVTTDLAHFWNFDLPANFWWTGAGGLTGDNASFDFQDWNGDGYPENRPIWGVHGAWTGKTE